MPIHNFQWHLAVRDYIDYLIIKAFLDNKELSLKELQCWINKEIGYDEKSDKIPLSLLSVKMKVFTSGAVSYLVPIDGSKKYKFNDSEDKVSKDETDKEIKEAAKKLIMLAKILDKSIKLEGE